VAEGYGVERFDVMYNDFVIVGPGDDPAGIGARQRRRRDGRDRRGRGRLRLARRRQRHPYRRNEPVGGGRVEPAGGWYRRDRLGHGGDAEHRKPR
jgi:tungstate transport system substrate-binding protein